MDRMKSHGAAPLVPLTVFTVAVVSHDMTGRTYRNAIFIKGKITVTRKIAGGSFV
ncbi:hypothetical protein [Pelotomaculum propionicicum]|uniref:Uncharacterized protein n=1 Tax=Pelotomaculum propionicicum TaxID=258475 RepID=A0A4Y7RUM7_9FIRM|nr:hypothetical protein [Pelotomaculum propionicicum]TEB12439.1 hypothetical protein Pmgp_01056 [Pelotomaculum propionicicum]